MLLDRHLITFRWPVVFEPRGEFVGLVEYLLDRAGH